MTIPENTVAPIVIYQSADGSIATEVKLEGETVWLSQKQIAELFDKDVRTINEHVINVFEEGELAREATIRNFRIVRQEGQRQVEREIEHYNLDVIISVGYRVKSKQGTQFRIWANRVLKDYLVQGYALNQQRLEAQQEKMDELRQAIALSARLIHNKNLSPAESRGILAILEKYSHALTVLDDYDHQRLQVVGTRTLEQPKITYGEAMQQIRLWRSKENLGGLCGNEKNGSFKGTSKNPYFIPTAVLRKKILAYISSYMWRSEIFSTPCIWAKSEFLEAPSRVRWRRSTRPSTARSCIHASRRRPPICCTLSSRTIRSLTAISESPPLFLSGFWSDRIFCITPWAKSALPITP